MRDHLSWQWKAWLQLAKARGVIVWVWFFLGLAVCASILLHVWLGFNDVWSAQQALFDFSKGLCFSTLRQYKTEFAARRRNVEEYQLRWALGWIYPIHATFSSRLVKSHLAFLAPPPPETVFSFIFCCCWFWCFHLHSFPKSHFLDILGAKHKPLSVWEREPHHKIALTFLSFIENVMCDSLRMSFFPRDFEGAKPSKTAKNNSQGLTGSHFSQCRYTKWLPKGTLLYVIIFGFPCCNYWTNLFRNVLVSVINVSIELPNPYRNGLGIMFDNFGDGMTKPKLFRN